MNVIERYDGAAEGRAEPHSAVEFWSTRQVSSNPFRYWQDLICRELVELQIETPQPQGFEASMLQRHLGSAPSQIGQSQYHYGEATTCGAHTRSGPPNRY